MNFENLGTKRTIIDGANVVLVQSVTVRIIITYWSTENPTDIEKVIAWSLTLVWVFIFIRFKNYQTISVPSKKYAQMFSI